ncbi:MAG: 4Fe-4S dicluster-binding protein, partial [Candidatus Thorarchaeota archaeon]
FGIIKKITADLVSFMERKGYETLDSMVGKALPKITTWTALTKMPPVIAEISEEKCTGCKKCVIACADGGYLAIQMKGKIAVVNPSKCDGCGLCAVICDDKAVEFVNA